MLLKMVEEERKVIEKEDKLMEAECKMMEAENDVVVEDKSVSVNVMDSSSTSVSSESDRDDEVLSSPNCNSSPDMMSTRMYKRNRANTTLSNSTLMKSPSKRR